MSELGWSAEALEGGARTAVDAFLDLCLHNEKRPVSSGNAPEVVGEPFPEEGIGIEAAIREHVERIIPDSLNVPHPLYLGLLNCSPLPAASLADLLVSAMNNNSGALHQGPAAAMAERAVLDALSELCFGEKGGSGMVLPGGSFANLQALVLARARQAPAWESGGPTAAPPAPVVYAGRASHFSVERAARIAGFGIAGVRSLGGQGRGGIDAATLERAIGEDRARGRTPTAVVATAGTTGTGAIDDLAGIARVCRRHGLWFHVDACYGGAALLLPEMRARFQGIEQADSVALDPHKWLFLPLTMSVLLVRDRSLELRTFESSASYIPNRNEEDGFRRGMATSRRASALTFWTAIRAHGWKTVRDGVRRNIALARELEGRLGARGFRVLADGELSIACVRYEPSEAVEEDLDRLQEEIRTAVVESGRAWFATVQHDDRTWMCFRITNLYTTSDHLEALVDLLVETGERLVGEPVGMPQGG